MKFSAQTPDPRMVIFADAKTIKRLNKLVPQKKYPHGGGPKKGSMQVVIVGCRGTREHERVVLGIEPVLKRGQEMKVTETLIDELLGLGLKPHTLLYDGAMRGVHILHYLRLGILAISPLKKPPKGVITDFPLGPHLVYQGDGSRTTVNVFAREGAPGVEYVDHTGQRQWIALTYQRVRQRRRTDRYAWYMVCDLPSAVGGGFVRVRVDLNKAVAENLRLFPKSDPGYVLYHQRSQIESLNRALDDSLYQGRAHSASIQGQRADCVGWGFVVNSVALFLHGPATLRGAKGLAALKAAGKLPP